MTRILESVVPARLGTGFRWLLASSWCTNLGDGLANARLMFGHVTVNLTYGAAWSVLVLYVTERLDMGSVGYGVATAVIAAGGLVGTASYGLITRRISLSGL